MGGGGWWGAGGGCVCGSKAVPLLEFLLVSLASYVVFVLSLFVPHLSFLCCLG